MVAAGNVANDLERSQGHDDDDDLFTSSIDTTSSVVSKGSKSKHKHKKKGRTDSQLSNASSKSAQKENKTASTKSGKCSRVGRRVLGPFITNVSFKLPIKTKLAFIQRNLLFYH